MKGVYSSADSLLSRASQRSLFIDNTYSVDSGGDPAAIPDLSFEQFKAFHEKFYHPSNSRIYFAGDGTLFRHLHLALYLALSLLPKHLYLRVCRRCFQPVGING
jgi:presequence protease